MGHYTLDTYSAKSYASEAVLILLTEPILCRASLTFAKKYYALNRIKKSLSEGILANFKVLLW